MGYIVLVIAFSILKPNKYLGELGAVISYSAHWQRTSKYVGIGNKLRHYVDVHTSRQLY